MIVFDFSNLAHVTFHSLNTSSDLDAYDLNIYRHVVLNKIGATVSELRKDFDTEIVLACDGGNYWRKDIFPHYKASRKKQHNKSDIDFTTFYHNMDVLIGEFKSFMPFKVLLIEKCEADDIIGTLCLKNKKKKIAIVSADKDFRQLCNKNVRLFNPIKQKFIDGEYCLFTHIVKGDKDDGIPNVLSENDCFVTGTRQNSMYKAKLEELLSYEINLENAPLIKENPAILERINENKDLIDLSKIPEEYINTIIEEYSNCTISKKEMFNYFMKNRLTKIMESGYYQNV